jgi:uncharacterized protein HemX
MSDARPPCDVAPGERIWLNTGTAEALSGCVLPEGVVFSFSYNEEPLMPETLAPADTVLPEASGAEQSSSPNAPAHKAAEVPAVLDVVAAPAQAQTPESTSEGTSEVAADAPPDLSQIGALANGDPVLMIALALIVVGGGTAGWKFWSTLSEQRHEQAMKRMEIDAQKSGLAGAQPPPCQAANAELRKEIASLEAKVARLDKNVKSVSSNLDSFDEAAFEKRLLKKVDEKLKPKATSRSN